MSDDDKVYHMLSGGFFTLLCDAADTVENVLVRYVRRIDIEQVFRSEKSFLVALQLTKWNYRRIKGKILESMIAALFGSACYTRRTANRKR